MSSGIWVLCELPATSHTPGSAAISCGRALGVAAGNQNSSLRTFAMDAAHGLAQLIVGRRGYGAGIEHHQIGVRRLARLRQSLCGERRFHRRSIRLRRAAAERLYVESLQVFILPLEARCDRGL